MGVLLYGGLAHARPEITLEAAEDRVVLANAVQRVVLAKGDDGTFALTTEIRDDEAWRPWFDAGLPVIQGEDFDLKPTRYRIPVHQADRAEVELSGRSVLHGFSWTLRVAAAAGTTLLRFEFRAHLERQLILRGLEPQAALWMNRPGVAMALNQGPGSIYHGCADAEWGNSFPAAYLWHEGAEAAVFFDAGALRWMSPRNLFRFRDCRVQAFSEQGRTGFGLRVVKRNFHELPAGELSFVFYLHSALRETSPSSLEALGTLVGIAAPLHPASAPLPQDQLAQAPASWSHIAAQVSRNLQLREVVWEDVPLGGDRSWNDGPAFPESTLSQVRVSTDYAVGSACSEATNRRRVSDAWDFSTCNNYLAGWLAYDRLHPEAERADFIRTKMAALPVFYEPASRLIRHAANVAPPQRKPLAMSWQLLTFALEMDKVRRLQAAVDFQPEIGGKFLQGLDGLIELARRTDYLFPQWVDPYAKTGVIQNDQPELGVVYEPWQAGSYAWLMTSAHELTDDDLYLGEAAAALGRLFSGRPFTVSNERYTRTYADPADFPITEIFGNAWGVAACASLHRRTGRADFRDWGGHFLHSLLRLTYWYESALATDARDQALGLAGLFRNHSGAFTGSPWENGEAYLALSIALRALPPEKPLPQMFNCYRRNSCFYFPPMFTGPSAPCERLMSHAASYLPIEDAYTLEHGGLNGGMGRAVYMSGPAFWNCLLFEACAEADDPEVMVLNLDALEGFEESIRSVRRSFLLFNPAGGVQRVRLRHHHLAEGRYRVMLDGGIVHQDVEGRVLMEGTLPLDLQAGQVCRLVVENLRLPEMSRALEQDGQARSSLIRRYRELQRRAEAGESLERLDPDKLAYAAALAACRAGDSAKAIRLLAPR